MEVEMYYKITNEQENHNEFQYKTGLNTDTVPWSPAGSCKPGGLYFCEIQHVLEFLNYGVWLREVTLPEGEEIYKDPGGNKYKAHQIILGRRRDLRKVSTWKYLIKSGADVHARDDHALRCASNNGHLEVVKYLVEHGADVHARDDYALRCASNNGHLEAVKYLVEHGADVHARDDQAQRWASLNGHLEAVKYLVEHGADVHAEDDFAQRWASLNGHLEVVEYLKSVM
jgi:hypothetical protein